MKALIPGSFDPITAGHAALIKRAAALFDEVIVCAFENCEKKSMFTSEQKLDMMKLVCDKIPGAHADINSGFLMDYAAQNGIGVIVKGARNASDFEYEHWLAAINRAVDKSIETVILPSEAATDFISSTVVRERIKYGKSVSDLVPPEVADYLSEIVQKKR